MAKTLSTGSIFAIASAYAASQAFSSITNASEAVASFAANPSLAAGDYVEVLSGWGRLNNRLVRVKTVSGSGPYLVTFESINTVDTTRYPAGSGAGSVRKVSTWTNLSQIKDIAVSGGEQQFTDASDIEDVEERQVPTTRSAQAVKLTVFDDPTLAWYTPVQAAHESATPAGYRMTAPNGTKVVANAYWSLQQTPNVAKKELMTAMVDISYAAQPVRYAS